MAERRDVRAALREGADELAEDVKALWLEVVRTAEKSQHVRCGNCGKSMPVPVPDLVSRAKAAETLVSLGYGKPATQKDQDAHLGEAVGKPTDELTAEERRLILKAASERLNTKGSG